MNDDQAHTRGGMKRRSRTVGPRHTYCVDSQADWSGNRRRLTGYLAGELACWRYNFVAETDNSDRRLGGTDRGDETDRPSFEGGTSTGRDTAQVEKGAMDDSPVDWCSD